MLSCFWTIIAKGQGHPNVKCGHMVWKPSKQGTICVKMKWVSKGIAKVLAMFKFLHDHDDADDPVMIIARLFLRNSQAKINIVHTCGFKTTTKVNIHLVLDSCALCVNCEVLSKQESSYSVTEYSRPAELYTIAKKQQRAITLTIPKGIKCLPSCTSTHHTQSLYKIWKRSIKNYRRSWSHKVKFTIYTRAREKRAITHDKSVGIKIIAFIHTNTSYPISVQSLKVVRQKLYEELISQGKVHYI